MRPQAERHKLALLLFSASCLASNGQFPGSGPELCAVPAALPVRPWTTCADFGAGSSPEAAEVDVAAERGETEAAQLLLRTSADPDSAGGLFNVSVAVTGVPSAVASIRLFQVGYVKTLHTPRYEGSGGGWRPDPLLPLPGGDYGFDVAPDESQGIWVEVTVDRRATPGNYTGTVTITCDGFDCLHLRALPFKLQVWATSLPTLEQSKVGAAWSGRWYAEKFDLYYTEGYWANFTNRRKWYDLLLSSRTPPDSLYMSPAIMRPIEEITSNLPQYAVPCSPAQDYVYLASKGMRRFAILDVTTLPASVGDEPPAGRSQAGGRADAADGCGLPEYSDDYVSRLIAVLRPTVVALGEHGLLDRAFVYGFDEQPAACEDRVRKLFGAVKAAFPGMQTMAVLNWSPMPPDLPVDIWVLQFQEMNVSNVEPWIAAGKEQWQYHCIEPSSLQYLNSFIERKAIQPRLLFWLAALRDAEVGAPRGWLYYETAYWVPCRSGKCGGLHRPKPLRRLAFEGPADQRSCMQNLPYTDFPPGNFIWQPDLYNIFANGDGFFVYPCEDGPCSTIRLSAIRDGLEDWELFSRLDKHVAIPLLRRLVRSATDWTEDPALLEATRREAAAALQAQHRAAVLA